MKKFIVLSAACLLAFQGVNAFAYYDASADTLAKKSHSFASQYDYHEGDMEKSIESYPDINYSSATACREDGSVYECPNILTVSEYAILLDVFGFADFKINGEENPSCDKCVIFNDRTLVPAEVFKEIGCDVSFDEDTYVTTVSDDNITLEIFPNLIGMRKNKQDGFYVPLEVCALFIYVYDTPYVPVRAVADEFGFEILWDAESRTVSLNNRNM